MKKIIHLNAFSQCAAALQSLWIIRISPAVATRIASRRSVVSPPSADRRPRGRRGRPGPGDFAMAGSIPTPLYIHTV